jgi:phosphatidylserine/phosphatidylglycerophosphate/cardiolipin synthase-like enzyme
MHGVFSGSAAADGDDNFKLVARSEGGTAMLALRHDFAIAFDGDALARVAELFDQAGNGQRGRKLAAFAIDFLSIFRTNRASSWACAAHW